MGLLSGMVSEFPERREGEATAADQSRTVAGPKTA